MCNVGNEKISTMTTNGYLEAVDIMELLGVSNQTVYSFIRKGKLKTDGSYYPGSRQRIKVWVEDFKEFLRSNPKYYERVYGMKPEVEVPEVKEVKPTVVITPDDVLEELIFKLEDIDSTIERFQTEIEGLKEQKEALKKVIEMF